MANNSPNGDYSKKGRKEDKDIELGEKLAKELYQKAQEELVACLLASKGDPSEAFEILSPNDFEEPKYELIYGAALELSRNSEVVDAYTIANYLENQGELQTVDGLQGLQQLTTIGKKKSREAPLKIFAKILRERSAKRNVKEILESYSQLFIGDSGASAADSLADLQSELNDQLYKLSNESTMAEISDVSAKYESLLEERRRISEENADQASGLQGIPTLLPSLNKYTSGFKAGQMITVAAATGVGKSVFAINCAVAAMQAGKSVMFFSLEMGIDEINDRIFSSISSIPMNDLKQGHFEESQRAVFDETVKELMGSKLTIDADAKQTVDGIRAKALKKAQSPEGLDFIVIDYLQLMTPTGRYGSRQEAVADMSRNVKLLAKYLGIPIMVLAQLNRQKSEEEDSTPSLDSIRESGAIAHDSDIVLILDRKKRTDEDIPPTRVILAKQRNGEADKIIKCHSDLECSLFREMIVRQDLESYTDEEMQELENELESQIGDFDEDDDLADWDDFE